MASSHSWFQSAQLTKNHKHVPPFHFIIRIISIIAVVVIKMLCPELISWISIILSIAFGHYLISILYSKRQIGQAFTQPHSALALLVLLMLGSTLFVTEFNLVIFFAIHHVFNEVYLTNHLLTKKDSARAVMLRVSGLIVHLLIYFILLRGDRRLMFLHGEHLSFLTRDTVIAALVVAYLFFAISLYLMRQQLKGTKLISCCGFEVVALIVVAATYHWNVKIRFLDIVLYHFMFWMAFPMVKTVQQGVAPTVRYVVLTVVCTGVFLLVSPIGVVHYDMFESARPYLSLEKTVFFQQFILWSYLHITATFALSSANPGWIARWFSPNQPKPGMAQGGPG